MKPARIAVLAFVFALPLGAQSLAGPGVSIQLAQFRARTVSDVHYAIAFDLNADTTHNTAAGKVAIHWMRIGIEDAIIDFRGRRLISGSVNGKPLPASAFNGAHITIPGAMLAVANVANFDFVTDIAATGASIIKAHDPDGSDYVYTLLVPADANQLFPCFDQPDLKARVTLQLTVPESWNAVANGSMRVATHSDPAAGKDGNIFQFTETRPLSTYLIAFAAGPWASAKSTVNGRTINVFVRKSRAREADLDTMLALSHKAVAWMEEYFGIRYPFEKIDFVLAPEFPFGGMEHPGAIFYKESSFIFRERPTLAARIGRFSTILHETAHQWFGDLVTMRWFDDLWLKEGFATYMAAKAQYALDSTTGAWKTFYQSNKPSAYAVDQTTGTNSLWQQLDNLDQAKSNYGAIVYNKAPSVLKQLNYLVGDEAFQKGLHQFLLAHSYGSATWQDLLGAVGKEANTSLDNFGANFMLRPGMPVLIQRIAVENGKITALTLTQRPAQPMSGPRGWPMRTQVLLAYADKPPVKIPVTLAISTEVVAARGLPAPQFVFANYEDYGYFLTLLDSASITALSNGALGRVTDPFLRTMLWGALWDQVREAQFDPMRFVSLALREMPRENDEQLFPNIVNRVTRSLTVYASSAQHDAALAGVEAALWTQAHDAARPYSVRRACLNSFISVAQTPDGIAKVTSLLAVDSVAGVAIGDPTRWEIVNRLTTLDVPGASQRVAAQAARDTTPDGRRRAFTAGAARKSADVKREYFTRYFSDKSLNEEWASGSLGAFNSIEHSDLTLQYLRPALDSLPYIQANRRIFYLGGWLGSFIGGQRSAEALAIVQKYLADHPALPLDLKQKVLQTVDELDRAVKIQETVELTQRDVAFFATGLAAAALLWVAVRLATVRRFRRLPRGEGRTHGYNFTDRVRMSLAAARTIAADLGQVDVGPEHILLGILQTEGVAVAVLQNLRIDLDKLRADIHERTKPGNTARTGPDLPFTARAKRVLEQSMASARELNHNYVGTEHILLGLIREGDSVAAKALAKAGVTIDNARAQFPDKPNDAA